MNATTSTTTGKLYGYARVSTTAQDTTVRRRIFWPPGFGATTFMSITGSRGHGRHGPHWTKFSAYSKKGTRSYLPH